MNYQTFEPNSDLKEFVKCYWILEQAKEEGLEKQTIVPDGCMEMIFHYGDLFKQYSSNGKCIIQPRCFVIGQLTRPLQIEPTGETGIFSVRFHPNGFLPFSKVSIKEMENKAVPLNTLFGKDASNIEEQVLKAASTPERIKLVEFFLTQKITDSETIDRIVKSTVELILEAKGQRPIEELSKQSNITRRSLERKFSTAIGLSPKKLSKTIRLQATLKNLLNKNFTSLTTLAYDGEYYDQAHFIKDFKEFTGFTPKEFYGNNLKMSALFYGTD